MEVSKGFEKFDICHHCKLLYPENFLIKCKYTSEKMGIPIQPAPYVDPYITQISKSISFFIFSINLTLRTLHDQKKELLSKLYQTWLRVRL